MGPGTLEDWLSSTTEVFIRPSFYEMARDYLNPLKRNGIDTLVLGCTHFPLLATAIQQVLGPGVRLISSAEETAREVAAALHARDQLAEPGGDVTRRFVTTGDVGEFRKLGSRVLRAHIPDADHVPIVALEALGGPVRAATLHAEALSAGEDG